MRLPLVRAARRQWRRRRRREYCVWTLRLVDVWSTRTSTRQLSPRAGLAGFGERSLVFAGFGKGAPIGVCRPLVAMCRGTIVDVRPAGQRRRRRRGRRRQGRWRRRDGRTVMRVDVRGARARTDLLRPLVVLARFAQRSPIVARPGQGAPVPVRCPICAAATVPDIKNLAPTRRTREIGRAHV